jgi:hypothetical protein
MCSRTTVRRILHEGAWSTFGDTIGGAQTTDGDGTELDAARQPQRPGTTRVVVMKAPRALASSRLAAMIGVLLVAFTPLGNAGAPLVMAAPFLAETQDFGFNYCQGYLFEPPCTKSISATPDGQASMSGTVGPEYENFGGRREHMVQTAAMFSANFSLDRNPSNLRVTVTLSVSDVAGFARAPEGASAWASLEVLVIYYSFDAQRYIGEGRLQLMRSITGDPQRDVSPLADGTYVVDAPVEPQWIWDGQIPGGDYKVNALIGGAAATYRPKNCDLELVLDCDKNGAEAMYQASVQVHDITVQSSGARAARIAGASKPACNDGVDNDGDGRIDGADPGCTSTEDRDESNPAPPPVDYEPEYLYLHRPTEVQKVSDLAINFLARDYLPPDYDAQWARMDGERPTDAEPSTGWNSWRGNITSIPADTPVPATITVWGFTPYSFNREFVVLVSHCGNHNWVTLTAADRSPVGNATIQRYTGHILAMSCTNPYPGWDTGIQIWMQSGPDVLFDSKDYPSCIAIGSMRGCPGTE